MTAIASTPVAHQAPGAASNPGADFATATATVALRNLRKFVRSPQLVLAGTISGVMFLLIFRYVFGGSIGHTGTLPYVDFMVPGFVMTGTLFTAMGSGTAAADDLAAGLIDRLRSLPIPAAAIVCGRVAADTVIVAWGLAITTLTGFLVGFRLHASLGSALECFGWCVLWGATFCWLFTVLGFFAGNAQAAQGLSFLVFPVTFVSSAYVPVSTMPGWMQAFANHQPITAMANAARILTEGKAASTLIGHPVGPYLVTSLLWSVGIAAICLPLAAWRLRRG
jgi:ABC-2 type transport system permease protein